MQKKLIALAVAAAFSAPAFADNSNVTVYGKINMDFENVQSNTTTTAATSLNRLQSNASRFGVKGKEDLGDGLAAIWQMEVQVDANGAAGNGFGNGTRNSNLGLKGDFGTVFFGIWDTPYKLAHNKVELFDNTTSFSSIALLGRANGTNFNTRQSQVIQYWTPKMSGFEGKISYGADNTQAAAPAANKTKTSLSGTYENDMFYAALGYESRPGQSQATVTDSATRLVGSVNYGMGKIGLTYENLSVGTAANVASTQKNVELMGDVKFGNSVLAAAYVKNGNLGATAATGANQATLRYGYNFSKRTELYAAYTSIKNDAATAAYKISQAGTVGSSSSAFGMGMIHSF